MEVAGDLLTLPRLGCVNVHPAPLPRYRGPDPLFWQVMNGETEVGMTVHRMDADFDTGAILAQGTAPIGPEDDIDDVNEKLLPLGQPLLVEAFTAIMQGAPGRPQPTEGGSYAPVRTEADRILDWSRNANQLHNQVRAWGSLGAYAMVDGRKWLVRRARVVDAGTGATGGEPGSAVSRSEDGMLVRTGDGLLLMQNLEPGTGRRASIEPVSCATSCVAFASNSLNSARISGATANQTEVAFSVRRTPSFTRGLH